MTFFKPFLKYLGVAGLLIVYSISVSHMNRLRADVPQEAKRARALSVDPTLLRIVSGPFKGLVADYLNIKASIFMGGAWKVTEEDWDAVYTLFNQSLYLDPLFFQTGYYTQGLLSWREGMHRKAIDMLKYHAEHRYWDWEPMFFVGFDYFYFLDDNESAAKYMKFSSEREGAPLIVGNLAIKFNEEIGRTAVAISLLKTLYENAKDGPIKEHYKKKLEELIAESRQATNPARTMK